MVYLILNSNIDKLKTVATDSNNSTPNVDKLDINELETVPATLKILVMLHKMMLLKEHRLILYYKK